MAWAGSTNRATVGIVGGGAAGTLTAIHLAAASASARRPVDVVLIDQADPGRGTAYATDDERHLLNVHAGGMSAYADDPDHFLRWLRSEGHRVEAGDFVPRCRYGRYLHATLEACAMASPDVHIRHVRGRVTALAPASGHLLLTVAGAQPVRVDAAVLALGVFPPGTDWAPPGLAGTPQFVADPWAPGVLAEVAETGGDVLLVGTGLTMVDVALTIDRPGRVAHAVSRRGRLPRSHATTAPHLQHLVGPELLAEPASLDDLRRAVTAQCRRAVRDGVGWRPVVDGLRPHTARLWAGLTDGDKARFLAADAVLWDVHRHRMPPGSARAIAAMRRDRRLRVTRGQVTAARPDGDGVTVTLDGTTRHVGWVVNCTGPAGDVRRVGDPLLDDLLARGLARTGPHGLGLATDDGRLLGVDADLPVWSLGALRRGELWESTAIPEIRAQADEVAGRVLDRAAVPKSNRPPRPLDRLGLPLSTHPEAAAAFNAGLDKVLQVQTAPEADFREAAELDPGFALAHAALALLGHEAGAPVDVPRSLDAAQRAALRRGDDRERSLVDVVARRVGDCQGGGAKALRRHLRDHPRDALAVSAAVPTIAFSGVTDIQQEAWALVEGLAPSYGDDWWYAGLLAFVRQDQGRYDEAEALSRRALDVQPSSGHAVHARTHVFYETGEHAAGLRWLDPWIATSGRGADHLAHFSWHAAMHELAMGDAGAVRVRYADHLAPPAVQGVRALVDSASMLWRCQVTGSWDQTGPLPVREVLDAVDDALLRRPTTAFTAMHAALALTAAGDTAGLARLRDHLAAQPDPVMSDVVVSLCDALAGYVEQRWCDAVRLLRLLGPWLVRLGGSAAQREIVEDTLLQALLAAGRYDEALALLDVRLDRRPSPLDRRRRREALAGAGYERSVNRRGEPSAASTPSKPPTASIVR